MEAEEALAEIAAEVRTCTKCDLHIGAHNGVPGSGHPHAEVFLVGQAPSVYDDRRGVPFSGPSGAFLDELLALAGLHRAEVFLTNLVRHRVPDGRALRPDEIAACRDYLIRQIAAVNPLVIVALGRGAAARFLPGVHISQDHCQAKVTGGGVVVALYKPAPAPHRGELHQTLMKDFQRAPPAALPGAPRPGAGGKPGRPGSTRAREPAH